MKLKIYLYVIFKKQSRQKTFEEIFKKGKTLKGKYFLLRFFPIDKNQKKFTFVVPSSVSKSAVRRNLLKRRGRYVLNLNKNKINSGLGMIFIFNKKFNRSEISRTKKDILFITSSVQQRNK